VTTQKLIDLATAQAVIYTSDAYEDAVRAAACFAYEHNIEALAERAADGDALAVEYFEAGDALCDEYYAEEDLPLNPSGVCPCGVTLYAAGVTLCPACESL